MDRRTVQPATHRPRRGPPPRTAITGEPLAPALPTVAGAQAAGTIGAEHVRHRQACEVDLARIAGPHTPDALRRAADRLMALVHPDGDFSDVDRARRRALIIGKQQADGMSKISGLLDPRHARHSTRC